MKKNIVLTFACACVFLYQAQAQEQKEEGYRFTDIKRIGKRYCQSLPDVRRMAYL